MRRRWRLSAAVLACVLFSTCPAGESTIDAVRSLEPFIGSFPPNVEGDKALDEIRGRYREAKQALDAQLAAQPGDDSVRLIRGHLQSMGHNIDEPGAFDGAVTDLELILKSNPGTVSALLELAMLWVNSNPTLAMKAEKLFRAAQCYHGKEPMEEPQRGLFFAFYYQGKVPDALRQATFLTAIWPADARYQRLLDIASNVAKRGLTRKSKPATGWPPSQMVSCN